jgi:hypothetical protein
VRREVFDRVLAAAPDLSSKLIFKLRPIGWDIAAVIQTVGESKG